MLKVAFIFLAIIKKLKQKNRGNINHGLKNKEANKS